MIYNTTVTGKKDIKGKNGLYCKVCFPLPPESADGGRMYADALIPVSVFSDVSVGGNIQVCVDRFYRVLDVNILKGGECK